MIWSVNSFTSLKMTNTTQKITVNVHITVSLLILWLYFCFYNCFSVFAKAAHCNDAQTRRQNKRNPNTFDCQCYCVVVSKGSLFFPAHLISCRLWQNNSQEKLRHWACTLLDSILNPLFTPGWHFFTLHVAALTPIQLVL